MEALDHWVARLNARGGTRVDPDRPLDGVYGDGPTYASRYQRDRDAWFAGLSPRRHLRPSDIATADLDHAARALYGPGTSRRNPGHHDVLLLGLPRDATDRTNAVCALIEQTERRLRSYPRSRATHERAPESLQAFHDALWREFARLCG